GNDAWDTTRLFGVQIISGPRNKNDANGGKPGYWTEGFLTLQRAVDNGIISLLANLTNSPNSSTPVQLQRFPYPAYTRKMIEIGVLFLPCWQI
uniref:Uncharacterized protein n=1 Tax=Plectus sambesii TaxID=2011161 RepID=A0A914WYC7_9BILA